MFKLSGRSPPPHDLSSSPYLAQVPGISTAGASGTAATSTYPAINHLPSPLQSLRLPSSPTPSAEHLQAAPHPYEYPYYSPQSNTYSKPSIVSTGYQSSAAFPMATATMNRSHPPIFRHSQTSSPVSVSSSQHHHHEQQQQHQHQHGHTVYNSHMYHPSYPVPPQPPSYAPPHPGHAGAASAHTSMSAVGATGSFLSHSPTVVPPPPPPPLPPPLSLAYSSSHHQSHNRASHGHAGQNTAPGPGNQPGGPPLPPPNSSIGGSTGNSVTGNDNRSPRSKIGSMGAGSSGGGGSGNSGGGGGHLQRRSISGMALTSPVGGSSIASSLISSVIRAPHHGSSSTVSSSAAPGPIPATTPLVVRQDQNGVQWIAFEYSRDRVKMKYTIRCDVESVNVDGLSQEFKTENCVYPRACCPKNEYKGNRLHYETECNTVGWALAHLNPSLRGKRGLIQRAVDSWRNSNQDPRLRSRRVRRMVKINRRKSVQAAQQMADAASVAAAAAAAAAASSGHVHQIGNGNGIMGGNNDPLPPIRGPAGMLAATNSAGSPFEESFHTHHHPAPSSSSGGGGSGGESGNRFTGGVGQFSSNGMNESGSDCSGGIGLSNANSVTNSGGTSNNGIGNNINSANNHISEELEREQKEARDIELFGDMSVAKQRKFILVEDPQRGTRMRIRVMLDKVPMSDIPDSYRKVNSVYQRSWFATEVQSMYRSPGTPPPSMWPEDLDDNQAMDDDSSLTSVEVPLPDGSYANLLIPRILRSIRSKECKLNEIGYRISWYQKRFMAERVLFLQRALDLYRNKLRSSLVLAGHDVSVIAPHIETRIGKRKWLERSRRFSLSSSGNNTPHPPPQLPSMISRSNMTSHHHLPSPSSQTATFPRSSSTSSLTNSTSTSATSYSSTVCRNSSTLGQQAGSGASGSSSSSTSSINNCNNPLSLSTTNSTNTLPSSTSSTPSSNSLTPKSSLAPLPLQQQPPPPSSSNTSLHNQMPHAPHSRPHSQTSHSHAHPHPANSHPAHLHSLSHSQAHAHQMSHSALSTPVMSSAATGPVSVNSRTIDLSQ